ncbi:MAG: ABC transporter ATP-binding protein [Lachnospiraceae bacterium]|nr:ABC transporter ATP-binding protein [Lachnospiraceae bacterium]MCD8361795.1 ABC transporter ATP-binding protein [Lachnospiraceae bacterium]
MGTLTVQCRDLWKSYGRTPALRGVNLDLESGRIIGLLGPNGSGKTTLIKILNGLLKPEGGALRIAGHEPGVYTKSVVSYLPDKPYFSDWMRVMDLIGLFRDFYEDFDEERAAGMCAALAIDPRLRMKSLSKGTQEKVQLILVMSRRAKLYLLDEPIAGVDPAARDFILTTILNNYNPEATVLISTHLIADVEKVLDEVIFLQNGQILCHESAEELRQKEGKSVDEVFRERFRMNLYEGGVR